MGDEKLPAMFIVFSPEGMTAPSKVYSTHPQAARVAWIMAREHPEQTFYVMARQGKPARFADIDESKSPDASQGDQT